MQGLVKNIEINCLSCKCSPKTSHMNIFLSFIIITRSSATAEIACDADETFIRGHSRSSVVVPIDAT